jgi:hypothetical protein
MEMSGLQTYFIKLSFIFAIELILCCAKIKLYTAKGRVSHVTHSQHVRSLLECSVRYKQSQTSLSFSYKPETKTCELSSSYPEVSTVVENGWSVYSRIGIYLSSGNPLTMWLRAMKTWRQKCYFRDIFFG